MHILYIGSNPSTSSPTDEPFVVGTKSRSIVDSWNMHLPECMITYINVSNIKTENNKPLSKKQIKESCPDLLTRINSTNPSHIVALGKAAATALTLLRQTYYEMPHPSGLNRQLNDKSFVEEKIKGLKHYLNPLSTESN